MLSKIKIGLLALIVTASTFAGTFSVMDADVGTISQEQLVA